MPERLALGKLKGVCILKVLVCGGREFTDTTFIHAELDRLHAQYRFDTVIEGDARGVDRIAGEWAHIKGIDLVEFPADWKGEGRHAALIRNERMLRDGKPDLVIAFPGGGGTAHTCFHAEQLGIPVIRLA
ncbi:DUF2493 domain-containing protein [Mesorhizobium carmichaelinearum]|uniref:DUF2493 domain-containing protein n=1 Tax=Mesorhizobium carmichaelinearum TaxID=1208188 RepID=UPI000BA3F293|nr:DUF2493 domain-containing protein [Mesorhizobium carmichaelinearum]